ncbi:MAG: dTDP-4-dehydrorhamnose reductase [Chitinophagaceae bacterium]
MKPLVAITGINGQVGSDLKKLHLSFNNEFDFLFLDRSLMDLSNLASIDDFFQNYQPQYFINCAAYTLVDKAETEKELAQQINGFGVAKLAENCKKSDCLLLHISTDYVFDGLKNAPYLPTDVTNPINEYGKTKLFGEAAVLRANSKNIVVRTSWVYNKTGKNFVNTMLRLMKEKESINVVNDQIGSPTYSPDLALALLTMIAKIHQSNHQLKYQNIYHFSNVGDISWFDFAVAIKEISNSKCMVNAIPTTAYPTPAKRSQYSVMDCTAITNDFGIEVIDWKKSLSTCLQTTEEI